MKTEKEKQAELRKAKKDAIKAAYELGYMRTFKNLEEEINNAKSIIAVDRILITCRRAS